MGAEMYRKIRERAERMNILLLCEWETPESGIQIRNALKSTLSNLAAAIREKKRGSNFYIAPDFPCLLYKAIGNISFWAEARRNGVKNLWERPYLTSIQTKLTEVTIL